MDILWILKSLTVLVWIYFIYIFGSYIFASFKINYTPDNPDKQKSRLPMIAFLTGFGIFSMYFFQPESIQGYFIYLPYIILVLTPLIIWDGLLPILGKKNVAFGGNYIFKQETTLEAVSLKKISRIDKKENSIIFQDLKSMVPVLIFHRRDYSDQEWDKLNAFLSKKFPKKLLDFTK